MTAKQLFNKTSPFCMAKLLLGGATVLIDAVLLAVLLGIGWLFGDTGLVVCFLIWCGAVGVVRYVLMHYFGYLVKAGHVAVIALACRTGKFPKNPVDYGKRMVTERFATSNLYFAADQLISAAVKEVQRGIEKVAGKLDFIPGMDAISGLLQFFVQISLGYIDECCMGWMFYNPNQDPWKCAADGVVIYAQNWKSLLKNAAITTAKTVGVIILMVLAIFIPVGLLFRLFKWSPFIAFILACLIAWVVKFAYLDSYIMCQMMAAYMQVAPQTTITFDLYGKLCKLSSSFKQMFEKADADSAQPAYAGNVPANPQTVPQMQQPARSQQPQQNQPAVKPVFCGECGAKNEPGTKFCAECGTKLG